MTSNPRPAANPGKTDIQTTAGRRIVQRASTQNLQGPRAAVEYIEAHLGEPLTLDAIAQATHYSKYHLHRCFVESLGITVAGYIWRRRLTEAARQLALTDRRIVDIAIECGFGSQQAFARAFKTSYKQPPHRFRCESAFYPLQLPALLADEFVSRPPSNQTTRLRFASPDDIPSWMELVGQTVDGYPHLDERAYLGALEEAIGRHEALLFDCDGRVGAAITFSRNASSIDFFGIRPQLRNATIARTLFGAAARELGPRAATVSTTTFRVGDKADTGYRSALLSLGFSESDLLEEYGYPTQRLVADRAALAALCGGIHG